MTGTLSLPVQILSERNDDPLMPGITDPGGPTTVSYTAVIVVYTLMIIVSLLVNILFGIIILGYIKRLFYRIVLQVVIANILSALSNAGISIISTFIIVDPVQSRENIYVELLMFLDNCSDQIVILFTILMALQRMSVFFLSNICEEKCFSIFMHICIFLIWCFSLGVAVFLFVSGCMYRLPAGSYVTPELPVKMEFTCSISKRILPHSVVEKFFVYETIGFPIVTFIIYLLIFIKLVCKRHATHNIRKMEYIVLKQAVVLFIVCSISSMVSYYVYYMIIDNQMWFIARKLTNTLEMFAGVIIPVLLYFTSKEIRKEFTTVNRIRRFRKKPSSKIMISCVQSVQKRRQTCSSSR